MSVENFYSDEAKEARRLNYQVEVESTGWDYGFSDDPRNVDVIGSGTILIDGKRVKFNVYCVVVAPKKENEECLKDLDPENDPPPPVYTYSSDRLRVSCKGGWRRRLDAAAIHQAVRDALHAASHEHFKKEHPDLAKEIYPEE